MAFEAGAQISEEELESQLEEELKALDNENVDQVDPQTGEKVSQQSEWSAKYMLSPPPKPRTLYAPFSIPALDIKC